MSFNKEQYVSQLTVEDKQYHYVDINKISNSNMAHLPKTIKILLENAIRNYDGRLIREQHINQLINWGQTDEKSEVAFVPSRIILQDFTGVPAVVDLAAMREAVAQRGIDPSKINPLVPVDLIIDHSVAVDYYGDQSALERNEQKEFERNKERYRFLKWATQSFENFRAVPPSTGICHQINLEYLGQVVSHNQTTDYLFPDTLVGTDSHTTMINGLGIVGWGVGGIEAEAGMLGQPLYFVTPEVIGVHITGQLQDGVTATDLVLTVTNLLRQENVVGKFVEYFGSGVEALSLPDRATIANMSPEYGATMGYFPVDQTTLDYLQLTGRRNAAQVKAYCQAQGLYGSDSTAHYTKQLELDLSLVEPSLAGPKRPQDRISLSRMKQEFIRSVQKPIIEGGFGLPSEALTKKVTIEIKNKKQTLETGSVVLAAITSCTNTSNPSVLIGAGLLAKNAVERGLRVPDYVKTSLTPGSRVVTEYLTNSKLLASLEELGFYITGYGCATCIGNSGPLLEEISEAIKDNDLLVASVGSGNRNFEGRIHPLIKANYLGSPMLVVAYALAGRVTIDFETDPLGWDDDGQAIYLRDIWPANDLIETMVASHVTSRLFEQKYQDIYRANQRWNQVEAPTGMLYEWDEASTYIRLPDFFANLGKKAALSDILEAKVLALLGDSITTDHISPAGSIPVQSPAAKYLQSMSIPVAEFNSYGSRRGNHEVMMRGTFGNIRIRNQLAGGVEGGYTKLIGSQQITESLPIDIYDAAMIYQTEQTNLIIIAGKEYGTGSSRDWAAKGPRLLGVKAVIAESYERIHRSNLVGMGILPLQFVDGQNSRQLGLNGQEIYHITGLCAQTRPLDLIDVKAVGQDGSVTEFKVQLRLDSEVDIDYYLTDGILQNVLLQMS